WLERHRCKTERVARRNAAKETRYAVHAADLFFLARCRMGAGSSVIAARRSMSPVGTRRRRPIMQYMLLISNDEAEVRRTAGKPEMEQRMAAYGAYAQALQKAGILLGSNRLKFSTSASTVRVANGKTQVLDGPYAEAKEQLGGYFMIEVPDLDAALSWAARCPGAGHGVVEVRPIWRM